MTLASRVVALTGLAAAVFALEGCVVNTTSDAERFREALPLQSDVSLNVPGSSPTAGGVTTKSAGLHIATGGAGGNAQYYQFTRDIAGAVDFTSAVILGSIWLIVHTEPTSIESKKAVWGPGQGNALDPTVWRFTVNEVGDAEYDYVLEGQDKNNSAGPWTAVLTGHGYGKSRGEHRQGWFKADNDAYKKLEPAYGHDEGTTKVTFDLKQLPATLAVELRPAAAKGSLDILVTHEAAGAGSVDIKGTTDIDNSKATKLEDLHLLSKWNSTGAGRADIMMSGGDLPLTVNASECWSTTFSRSYYKDTVDFEPKEGDETLCAFSAATL